MMYFWLLLVKFLFRRLSTAFTIVLLGLEIVLDAERVHLFIVLIGVEPFTVKKHLVSCAWRVRALHYVWVIYLHLLETTLDCCVVHNNAGRIIQTELLLQLTGSFRALWSLAAGVMTAAILMWYATWSLIWQHSQSIIVDLASVEFLSYVLDSLIIIDAWALTWLTFLQLWLVDKLLDEWWVQQVWSFIVLLLVLILMLGRLMSSRLLCLMSRRMFFVWLDLLGCLLGFGPFINFNEYFSRIEILLLHYVFVHPDLVSDLWLNIS